MDLWESILLKRGFRRDTIWTHPHIYKSFLVRIPLFFDTLALLKSQFWPRERLERLSAQKLQNALQHASRVPFWRELFDQKGIDPTRPTTHAFRSLPIISKKEFNEMHWEEYSNIELAARSIPDHTSGSTGRPFNFVFDWMSELRSFAVTERILRSTGRARVPVIYMRSRYRQGFTFYKHLWFYLRGFSSVKARIDELSKIASSLRGDCILYGYTSSVVEVARQAEDRGISIPLRSVMATGENISETSRALIERVLSKDFRMVYASREAGWLGFECEHKTMHINEEWAHIEIIDEDDKPVPDGKSGRIIVTCYEAEVMPLIRYEIGDRGIKRQSTCPCGRTLATIELSGRQVEHIQFSDGRTVSLLDVSASLDRFGNAIRQFQIVLLPDNHFKIRVVPGPLFDAHMDSISEYLIRFIHPSLRISWEKVDEIAEAPSGKARYFIRETDTQHVAK